MNEFQENILDHFKNPRNYGKPSWSITNSNDKANISCGDKIYLYAFILNNHIDRLAFEGEGCSICIASASIITDEFRNKDLSIVKDISDNEFLNKYIGINLTISRRKCALLAFSALQNL